MLCLQEPLFQKQEGGVGPWAPPAFPAPGSCCPGSWVGRGLCVCRVGVGRAEAGVGLQELGRFLPAGV